MSASEDEQRAHGNAELAVCVTCDFEFRQPFIWGGSQSLTDGLEGFEARIAQLTPAANRQTGRKLSVAGFARLHLKLVRGEKLPPMPSGI